MWDQRYDTREYVYGELPNEFLRNNTEKLVSGFQQPRVLSLGEGEGRNACYLAGKNAQVTAMDLSSKGLEKAALLAQKMGVTIQCQQQNLADYRPEPQVWEAIINIYCHMPSEIRLPLYERLKQSLVSGGRILMELYTPEQLSFQSGGPKNLDMLVDLDELTDAFSDFDILMAEKTVKPLNEGILHQGDAAVLNFIAQKPA